MARPDRERSAVGSPEDASKLFRALSSEYRRATVRVLDETHTPVTRDALATYVARELLPDRPGADFVAFRDRALVRLHQIHLPALAEADVIDLDAGRITRGPLFSAALALLDATP